MTDTIIHPTAIIEPGARLGTGCIIHAHALIGRHCILGDEVVVHPFAVLGGLPQDLRFKDETPSQVQIGARTVIREYVTINRATQAGEATRVGADCFLMAASHVAHDGQVGNRVVMANAVLLGGHVHVGDFAFLGGGAVVHQFGRIGESAMIGGGIRVTTDIAPFCLATDRIRGLNLVGLRRRGFTRAVLTEIKAAFHALRQSGNLRERARAELDSGRYASPEARQFLEFFLTGRRAFLRMRRRAGEGESEA